MRNAAFALLIAAGTAAAAAAQSTIRIPSLRQFAMLEAGDPDRAMLGITTSAGGLRDTLGLLVESVVAGSPAGKAGIKEGNRLQAINGINLKLSPEDAADSYMQGINQNRLTREMRKAKAGDDVTLQVWGDGRTRTVKVSTVAANTLESERRVEATTLHEDQRAAVGVTLSATGKRDTAGVFVQFVVADGPAEKAGIVEGDRIASVNGVDVRVAREDAGDSRAATARLERVQREIGKLKPGQTADFVIVSGGRSRTVKVTVASASDVNGDINGGEPFGFSFDTGDGVLHRFGLPGGEGSGFMFRRGEPTELTLPRGRVQGFSTPEGDRRILISPRLRSEIQGTLDRALPRAMDELRRSLREQQIVRPRVTVRTKNRTSM